MPVSAGTPTSVAMTLVVSQSHSSRLNPGIQSIIQRTGFIAELLIRTGVGPLPASLRHLYVVPLSCYSHPLFSWVTTCTRRHTLPPCPLPGPHLSCLRPSVWGLT